jgi:hypothetical protein
MWIIPKQLHTSACVQDMKALALDCDEFSQMSEKSLMWRSKPSQPRTWLRRWKMEGWMQHLSSRILKPSHTEGFVDAWTSSLGDSRANLSVLLESVKQLKILDTSFPISGTESETANLELFSWKTLRESSPPRPQTENQFSSMSSESWKAWVTEQRQEYSQRVKSAHLIRESGSLSWPTITVNESHNTPCPSQFKRNTPPLGTAVIMEESWPTSTVAEGGKIGCQPNYGQKGLSNHPAIVGQPDQANHSTSGKSRESQGKLNPNWVEQLMGLPVGWTDLGSWATESSRLQQPKPLSHSSRESYEPVQDNVH